MMFEKGTTVVYWLEGASVIPSQTPDGRMNLQFNVSSAVVEGETEEHLIVRIPSVPTELTNVHVRKSKIVFIGEPSQIQASVPRLVTK